MQTERNYLPTTTKHHTPDYPYSFRLRCEKWDWIEWKPGKGFRHVYQTLNPKTNRLNKPKADTYCPILLMFLDENGHVQTAGYSLSGDTAINNACAFLNRTAHYFTDEQVKDLYGEIVTALRGSIHATCQWLGAKAEDLIPIYDKAMKAAISGYATGERGHFTDIFVDADAVKAVCPANYQPFKVTKLEF